MKTLTPTDKTTYCDGCGNRHPYTDLSRKNGGFLCGTCATDAPTHMRMASNGVDFSDPASIWNLDY